MEYILAGACIILALTALALAVRISVIRREMRNIKKELILTRDKNYNRQLTVTLIDKSLSEMTAEINRNLDYQKALKYKTEKAELSLRQSVSDIAHDLRTPLTAIKGNIQLLEREEQLSPRSRDYLRICAEKADAMKAMADDFFELSVLESDNSSAQLEKTDITALLMQFIADNEGVIRTHNLTPEIIFPEKSIFVMADRMMLTRMLGNLLNNVIKYANNSFTISLEENDSCVLTFSNSVPSDRVFDTDMLFERTYRGDKARQGGGAGLGLYIVKLLAEKQNAQVSAEKTGNILSMRIVFNIVR